MKIQNNFKRALLVACITSSGLFVPSIVSATSYAWVPTGAATASWNASANWSPNTAFPNAPGDIANLNINLTTNQTVALNVPITVGSVIFGDTSGASQQTISAGTAGSFTFDNLGSTASLTRGASGSGATTVSSPMTLVDDLEVTNNSTGVLGLSGGIRGNKNMTKKGTGPVTLGLFISTGNVTIDAGILTVGAGSLSYGQGYGDVIINSGGTLNVSSSTTILNGLTVNSGGAVTANNRNVLVGFDGSPINISGTYTNNLAVNLYIQSDGLSVINSANSGSIATALIRTLRGSGTVRFDYNNMSDPTNMVTPAARWAPIGGTLELYGKSGVATSQTFADLPINPTLAADQTIKLTPNDGGTVAFTLTLPNILRGAGNTLNFIVPANTSVTTGTPIATTNGLLNSYQDNTVSSTMKASSYAVFNGNTWATNSGTSIVGLSTYTPSTGPITGTDNVDVVANLSLAGTGGTVNSLRFNTATANQITLGASDALLLNSGGILVTSDRGANDTIISGGSITGNAGGVAAPVIYQGSATAAELIVHQHNTAGVLNIDSVITDNGSVITGLTKGGPGTLVLSKANAYTGTTFLAGGITKLGVANAIPHVSGGGGVGLGGTLDLNGFNTTLNGLDVRVSGKVMNSTSSNVTLTLGDNNGNSSLNSGGLTVEDGTGGGTTAIVKTGTGNFFAMSPVTYSGGTVIQSGAVSVGGGATNLGTPSGSGLTAFESTATAGMLGTGVVTLNGGTLSIYSTSALKHNTLVNNIATGGIIFESTTASWTNNAFTLGGLEGTGDITLANNAGAPAAVALSVGNNNATTAAYTGVLSGTGSLSKIGIGTTTLGGTNTYTGNTTVTAGTLNLTGSHTTGANYNVASSANLVTNNVRVTNSLTVNGNTTVNASGWAAGASKVETLSIGAGGKLNLKDNDLVVGTGTVAAVRTAIKTGVAGAAGITSDLPAFTFSTGFGYALGNDSAISPLLAGSLTGQTYDADSVLVKYTYLGDADLDGDSDLNDLGLWAQSFTGDLGNPVTPATFWTSGDFDYDGDTDLNDLGFWASTFTGDLGGGAGSLIVVAPGAPASALSALNSMGITVVPEPSTFILGGIGLAGLAMATRRRKR